MILEVGKKYSKEDIKAFFGVSESVWKKKEVREALLLHLSNYYEYEVKYNEEDRRKKDYIILKQIAPYEEYTNKRESKNAARDKAYEDGIIETIEEDNVQTAKNVSRIIKDREDIIKLNHSENTCYEYTRVRMSKWFGTKKLEGGTKGRIIDKIWCKLNAEYNCYEPLSDKQIEAFYEILHKTREEAKEEEENIISDYQNGMITKAEMIEAIGYSGYSCFILAQKFFKSDYGFTPLKVPVYELSAFEDESGNCSFKAPCDLSK